MRTRPASPKWANIDQTPKDRGHAADSSRMRLEDLHNLLLIAMLFTAAIVGLG
jgi:hypothetical protein